MKVGDVVQRRRGNPDVGIISEEACSVGEGKNKKRIFVIFWSDSPPKAHVETGLKVVNSA